MNRSKKIIQPFYRADVQIGQLLLVLAAIILVAPSVPDDAGIAGMLLLCLVIASLAGAIGPLVTGRPVLKRTLRVSGGLAVIMVVAAEMAAWNDGLTCAVLCCLAIYHLVMMLALFYHLFRKVPRSEKLLAAISFYLLTGITFSHFYAIAGFWIPTAFGTAQIHMANWPDYLYFSFITLTSVGYGDISPSHHFVQSMTVLESLTGVLSPTIMIARFVGNDD